MRALRNNLNRVKKLEIALESAHQEFAADLQGGTGYTIWNNLSGEGRYGFHEGRLMFDQDAVLIMIIVAAPPELVEPIVEGFSPSFNNTGVAFISEIQVSRLVNFRSWDNAIRR